MSDPGCPTVTLYTSNSCGLCDGARDELEALAPKLRFRLEVVSIESDPRLQSSYSTAVPVVAIGDDEIARAPIRRGTLEPRLVSALSGR